MNPATRRRPRSGDRYGPPASESRSSGTPSAAATSGGISITGHSQLISWVGALRPGLGRPAHRWGAGFGHQLGQRLLNGHAAVLPLFAIPAEADSAVFDVLVPHHRHRRMFLRERPADLLADCVIGGVEFCS